MPAGLHHTFRFAVLIAVAFTGFVTPARAEHLFASWAAVVIAGDWQRRGHSVPAYDNARRDVATALVAIGFDPAHVRQFSSQPQWFPQEQLERTDDGDVKDALDDMVAKGATGCLFYLTSQGRKRGDAWFGEDTLSPDRLNRMLRVCGERPTVVVISACYSGAFVPVLQAPNRMVFTSARADRTSFGCGVEKYPYFDACVLENLPDTRSFITLAREVTDCVSKRERDTHTASQSEPQLSVGAGVEPFLDHVAVFPRRQ